jgi:MFS family permease
VPFWIVTYTLFLALLGSVLPTPLYDIYQQRWRFSDGILTAIFGVYVVGVLAALIFVGHLSDQIGRRRVLLPALVPAVVSTLIFVFAQNVLWLFVARLLIGLAVGVFTATATAALSELEPRGNTRFAALMNSAATSGGLADGAGLLGLSRLASPRNCGDLADPRDRSSSRPGVDLRPQRLGVQADIRPAFVLSAITIFCTFSVSGLFASLGPSLVRDQLHLTSVALGGAVVFALLGASALTQLLLRNVSHRTAMGTGLVLIASGLILVVFAVAWQVLLLLFLGAVCAGVGHGLAFMGSLGQVNHVAPPAHRGEVASSYFFIAYLGVALPSLGVGFAVGLIGLYAATILFVVVIDLIALGIVATMVRSMLRDRSTKHGAESSRQSA